MRATIAAPFAVRPQHPTARAVSFDRTTRTPPTRPRSGCYRVADCRERHHELCELIKQHTRAVTVFRPARYGRRRKCAVRLRRGWPNRATATHANRAARPTIRARNFARIPTLLGHLCQLSPRHRGAAASRVSYMISPAHGFVAPGAGWGEYGPKAVLLNAFQGCAGSAHPTKGGGSCVRR